MSKAHLATLTLGSIVYFEMAHNTRPQRRAHVQLNRTQIF